MDCDADVSAKFMFEILYAPANLLANVLYQVLFDNDSHRGLLKDAKMMFVLRFRSFILSEMIDICLSHGTLFPSSTSCPHVNRWLSKWFLQDREEENESDEKNQVQSMSVPNKNGKRRAISPSGKRKKKKRKIDLTDNVSQAYRAKTRTTLQSSIIANLPLLISIVSHLVYKHVILVHNANKYFNQFYTNKVKDKYALLKESSNEIKVSFKIPGVDEEMNLCSLLEIVSCGNDFKSMLEKEDTNAYGNFLNDCRVEFLDMCSKFQKKFCKGKEVSYEDDCIERYDNHFVNFFLELLNSHHSPNIDKILTSDNPGKEKKKAHGYVVNLPKLFKDKFGERKVQDKLNAISVLEDITREHHSKFLYLQTVLHQAKTIFEESSDKSTDDLDSEGIYDIVLKKTLACQKSLKSETKEQLDEIFFDCYSCRNVKEDLGLLLSKPLDCSQFNTIAELREHSFALDDSFYEEIKNENGDFDDGSNDDMKDDDDEDLAVDEVRLVAGNREDRRPFFLDVVEHRNDFTNFDEFFLFVLAHADELLSRTMRFVPIFHDKKDVTFWYCPDTQEWNDHCLARHEENLEITNSIILQNVMCLNSFRKKLLHALTIGNCMLVNFNNKSMNMNMATNFGLLHNCSRFMHVYIRHVERHLIQWAFDTYDHEILEVVRDQPNLYLAMHCKKEFDIEMIMKNVKNFFDTFFPTHFLFLILKDARENISIMSNDLQQDDISFPFVVRKHASNACNVFETRILKIRDEFKKHFNHCISDNSFFVKGQESFSLKVNRALKNIDVLLEGIKVMLNELNALESRHPKIIENLDFSHAFRFDENPEFVDGTLSASLLFPVERQNLILVNEKIDFIKIKDTFVDVFSKSVISDDDLEGEYQIQICSLNFQSLIFIF